MCCSSLQFQPFHGDGERDDDVTEEDDRQLSIAQRVKGQPAASAAGSKHTLNFTNYAPLNTHMPTHRL